ncbi:MAG: 1,6-anhydro-N-acetylmuramyl-L-alanine amidase AmpD [Cellvibrionaceae bacterium]|nr:1,6-anhydro-N-acetylmuramyl-L-alanine amidase AmpD [Cellvibrionaceae bacterium]
MTETGLSGWLDGARACPSPNYNQRPAAEPISLLVIHNISLPPGQFGGPYIEDFFCNRLDCGQHPYFASIAGLEVSAHFLIDRAGRLCQFVPLEGRAWHAGQSSYGGRPNCNDYSIGIELEGDDQQAYSQAQYQALAKLSAELIGRYPQLASAATGAEARLPGFNICGHSDIAPGRKTDPGASFDWGLYQTYLARAL